MCHHQAPHPDRPSAKVPLCCSAAQAQGDARTVHRQPGWTPRPGLLPLPGHVSSLLSDKFQLPAAHLLAFAQTQLALFCISWRGQVNFTYFKRRACPTNLVLNTSPSPLQLVPSQHEYLATDLLTPLLLKRNYLRHLHPHSLVRSSSNVRSACCYLLPARGAAKDSLRASASRVSLKSLLLPVAASL